MSSTLDQITEAKHAGTVTAREEKLLFHHFLVYKREKHAFGSCSFFVRCVMPGEWNTTRRVFRLFIIKRRCPIVGFL